MTRFLALCGSQRAASSNMMLLEAMAASAPNGTSLEIFRGIGTLPIFNPDLEGEALQESVADMLAAVRASDGVIIACPEYAHGVPGGLKNALDWMVSQDVAVEKPAMMVHASARSRHLRQQLAEVLRTMSFRLREDDVFEVNLLGKAPDSISLILKQADIVAVMQQAVRAFAVFAGADKSSTSRG